VVVNEFVEYVRELLAPLGAVRVRRMFGGYGIYHGERMFALVVADVLYLKADAHTAPRFEQRGRSRFAYIRQGRVVQLSYYSAPEEIFDDPDAALQWARLADSAACRSGARSGGGQR
jgi:DNA transformation protein